MGGEGRKIRGIEEVLVNSITSSDYSPILFHPFSYDLCRHFQPFDDKLVMYCIPTYFELPCLALPCLALPCLALPCLALPCFDLCCLALSFTVLFDHAPLFFVLSNLLFLVLHVFLSKSFPLLFVVFKPQIIFFLDPVHATICL